VGQNIGPTKDMVERGRSGAYIPIGKMQRSQLEATSPWSFAEKAKRLHAEDICPDCVAEQSLKKGESVKAREDILQAASLFHGGHHPAPGSQALPTTVSDSEIATASDVINGAAAIVVIECEDKPDRKATDPRRASLTRGSNQRMSENLTKASKAVTRLSSVDEHPVQADHAPTNNKSEPQPEPQPLRPLKIKSCSMSELINELHAIAADMKIELPGSARGERLAQASGEIPITPINSFDAEALLSEPASPGPTSDTALAEAIAAHQRSQTSIKMASSSPSEYVTAFPTRNNSLQGPIRLPSSILRATDFSPITANSTAERPPSRRVTLPSIYSMPRFVPGQYPSSPALRSPWFVQSPKPTKRVRVSDRWPPEHGNPKSPELAASEEEHVYIETELQKAVQEVASKEKELHRAVREAAEMERMLRRRVRTYGGLSGAFKRQK
jgi:hypothetical protein